MYIWVDRRAVDLISGISILFQDFILPIPILMYIWIDMRAVDLISGNNILFQDFIENYETILS